MFSRFPLARAVSVALLALALGTPAIAAVPSGGPSAADLAALHGYVLGPAFLQKWVAIVIDPQAPLKALDLTSLGAGDAPKSLDEMVATLDARPGVRAYLASQGLSVREYVLGSTALMTVAMVDTFQKHPQLAPEGGPGMGTLTTPANLAFYRQHRLEIHQVSQAAGRRRLQAEMAKNGGNMTPEKISPCLTVAVVAIDLAAIAEPGTAAAPASSREQIAQGLHRMSGVLTLPNLHDDVNDIADEIARQAAAPRFTSTPKFSHALDDMTAWTKAQCH
jgi:hypothetical protein